MRENGHSKNSNPSLKPQIDKANYTPASSPTTSPISKQSLNNRRKGLKVSFEVELLRHSGLKISDPNVLVDDELHH